MDLLDRLRNPVMRENIRGGVSVDGNAATREMALAADEIERLRALLVLARVELTGIANSENTVAKIDAALTHQQKRGQAMRTGKQIVEAGWSRPSGGTTQERLDWIAEEIDAEFAALSIERPCGPMDQPQRWANRPVR